MDTPIVFIEPMVHKSFHFVDWSAVYTSVLCGEVAVGGEGTFPGYVLELVGEAGFEEFFSC